MFKLLVVAVQLYLNPFNFLEIYIKWLEEQLTNTVTNPNH